MSETSLRVDEFSQTALNPAYLTTFVQVARFGSLSKAAAYLNLSQPAISRQIRRLEEDLGAMLVVRHGRGVALTEAGAVLNEHSREFLSQVASVRSKLVALKTTPSGRVDIGFPVSIGPYLAPALLEPFRKRYPDVSLNIHEGPSNNLLEWLVSGRIDFGVLHLMKPVPNLIAEPLFLENLYLAGKPGAPGLDKPTVSMKDVAGLHLYLPDQTKELRRLLDNAAHSVGIELNVPVAVDSLDIMRRMAAAGSYTILPLTALREGVQRGVLAVAKIENPVVTRVLVLATTSSQPLSAATRALAEWTRRTARKMVSGGEWSAALPDAGQRPLEL